MFCLVDKDKKDVHLLLQFAIVLRKKERKNCKNHKNNKIFSFIGYV